MDSSSKLTIVKRAGVDLPLEIINFLPSEECLYLIKYFKKSPKRYAKHGFWDGRVVDLYSITDLKVRKIVEDLHARICGYTCKYYGEDYIYVDYSNLVYWGPNNILTPHCDNMDKDDPQREHDTPHRTYSAVLCLNEDYEGGYTIFPELNVEYPGVTSRLIVFPSGRSHLHGVTEVTSGSRYTFAMWMTKSRNKIMRVNSVNPLTFRLKTIIKNTKHLSKRFIKRWL